MNPALRILLLGGGPFTPLRLFRANEQGFFFVNDISTMYQDSAGTTPAAVDQPVGKWLDVSGRGNHATQATSANRPTLKQDTKGNYYVHFNGTNQWMQTGSVDFTGTDKMTVFAGATKLSDAAAGIIIELGNAGLAANPGSLSLGSSGSNGTDRSSWLAELRGTLPLTDGGQRSRQPRTYAAPSSAVLSALYDLAGTSAATDIAARIGGAVATCFDSGNDPGGGNFSNAAFTMGARVGASLFLNGDIYCLGARGASTTDTLIAQAERYVAGRMGLSL